MEFRGDYHLHTTYSDGRGTLGEMAEAGAGRGLEELGFAEHGPRNIGTGIKSEHLLLQLREEIKQVQKQLRAEYPQLTLYTAVEANVISRDGKLDVSRKVMRELDYIIVGLHPYIRPDKVSEIPWLVGNSVVKVYPGLGRCRRIINDNTKALVEAIYRYEPPVISHPGLKMTIDLAETAQACLAKGTCWEINTGHKFPDYQTVRELAAWGVDFLVNSDAHFPESVGALEYGAWVLEKAGVPPEQIKNARR